VHVAAVFPVVLIVYYLVWKYLIGFFNQVAESQRVKSQVKQEAYDGWTVWERCSGCSRGSMVNGGRLAGGGGRSSPCVLAVAAVARVAGGNGGAARWRWLAALRRAGIRGCPALRLDFG